jgi:hypothetical protein
MCPTTAESKTYAAAGACSGAGTGNITISTQPGLCALSVLGGATVGLPDQGQFTGLAGMTNYDIAKGNFVLAVYLGNAQDGSSDTQCTITSLSSQGQIELSCEQSMCTPDDCGGGGSCSMSTCTERLTPQ